MRRSKTTSSLLALLLATSPLAAQEFQIRTQVDLVVVPFTVKGNDGELVTGMEAHEFTVWEDGVEQSIERFSIDPIPLSAAVVIDTGVGEESLKAIQDSIPAIVFAFGPLDEVTVFRYNNRVIQVQDFTADPVELRGSLDTLKTLRPTEPLLPGRPVQEGPVINGIPTINTARIPSRADIRVLHDAVYEATLALRNRAEDRRKVIVLISDGNATRSEQTLEDNLLSLIQYEIQVYPIALNVSLLERLSRQFNDTLDQYATVTGGDFYNTGSGRLEEILPHIAEQARNQYVLTYVSSNPLPTDRIDFRRIEVFSDKPYEIVHRAGYYQTP